MREPDILRIPFKVWFDIKIRGFFADPFSRKYKKWKKENNPTGEWK